MYTSLNTDMLSVSTNSLGEVIDLAARHGFDGVDASPGLLGKLSEADIDTLTEKFSATGRRPGYIGLPPGRIPVPEADWTAALEEIPSLAAKAASLGYTRAAYVLLPFHETLDREAALDEHIRRLRQVTPILADNGIRLGLEYVAAPSRRAPYEVHTIFNLAGTLELIGRVNAPNLGLMLDTFHWHGAAETGEDLRQLTNDLVVVVHANDAPDLPLTEHTVMNRALPGATGVIDSTTFFSVLKEIGYNGPVTCEPMAPAIEALGTKDPDEILTKVKASLEGVL